MTGRAAGEMHVRKAALGAQRQSKDSRGGIAASLPAPPATTSTASAPPATHILKPPSTATPCATHRTLQRIVAMGPHTLTPPTLGLCGHHREKTCMRRWQGHQWPGFIQTWCWQQPEAFASQPPSAHCPTATST